MTVLVVYEGTVIPQGEPGQSPFDRCPVEYTMPNGYNPYNVSTLAALSPDDKMAE